ncbi:MAG: cytochrome-c oxidase, cbb3-type subunit III [Pseudomonadota bacterium]
MASEFEKDPVTGIETTGHEWDGIKELNNPLPRWWLYVLYATIVWSIAYWVAMPAWPTVSSYTKGLLGYSQRERVAADLRQAVESQSMYLDRIATSGLQTILDDPELLEFSLAGGAAAFGDNCAPCHGTGAQGFLGYPNLNDDDWIWGGTLEEIQATLKYGIRADHEDTRFSEMPRFLKDEILTRDQVRAVVAYVMALNDRAHDSGLAETGSIVFAENCAACHGEDAKGSREFGAPNLTNGIWLYGGEEAQIYDMIANSRKGVMPAWEGRLSDETIKQLVIYVHSLGGGQ